MAGHVARRSKMDDAVALTSSCHTTPRSFSWTRTARQPAAMDARFARSRIEAIALQSLILFLILLQGV
ncbi:hypothetical protein Y032_0229g2909 [Ancylostoma ceylanicum]|uniref:Uncharacterized protein n=1 Tax=Ancylostoma ceylanicum TaxID=53326 RepID=A0A016SGX4_9BILA|nr:hypothetical protein Y032_0229g2909 [Ancylostoma ceylanicum]